MEVKLYYCETMNPRKACAVARHLKAPVEYVFVDLLRGEHMAPGFAALNPNRKVPVLVEGDGRILWESTAIMCRLAEQAGSDLWPRDGRQVEVMRWLSWDMQHFMRVTGALYFEHLIKPLIGMGGPDAGAVAAAQAGFRTAAAVLEGHLAGRDWLVGSAPTVADFAVAVTLPYAADAAIPLAEFPAISRWHDRLGTLEGWLDPFPPRPHAN